MSYWTVQVNVLPLIILLLQLLHSGLGFSVSHIQNSCSDANAISVVGGTHSRLVTEGGRLTLTCCMMGVTNGHDHEQLVWYDPQGKELSSHFTNPHLNAEQTIYSVPDFRSPSHLASMLVIRRFEMEDAGVYSCRKANPMSAVEPVHVTLGIRPRLLADYRPVQVTDSGNSDTEVVAGRPVFVPLEEGRRGDLTCRINPNVSVTEVHLTWYFKGRQLVAPSLVLSGNDQRRPGEHTDDEQQNEILNDEMIGSNPSEIAREQHRINLMQQYERSYGRSVSVDPAEFGIHILESGQVLQIERVDDRHAGTYICKAEIIDTTLVSGNISPGEKFYESFGGRAEQPLLVQLQAIRGIVFSPPRMLPGSPREVLPTATHETSTADEHFGYKRHTKRGEPPRFRPMSPAPRYYMHPASTNVLAARRHSSYGHKIRPVAQEGGKLVLECQVRGKPSPQIMWFRGGMGSSMPSESRTFNFDQHVKQSLEHVSLDEVRPQLGRLIVDNERLHPAAETENTEQFDSYFLPPTQGLIENAEDSKRYRLGRFSLSVYRRPDDTGDPVISVSRLTIAKLKPTDATRYTCVAILDLRMYGGTGNYTDVGSTFPEIVLRPRFVKSGTNLESSGFPGENATLTCEAFGGLPSPNGLRIRLLRGPAVPSLIRLLTGSRRAEPDDAEDRRTLNHTTSLPMSSIMSHESIKNLPESKSNFGRGITDRWEDDINDIRDYESRLGKGNVEVVRPAIDPRYQLSVKPDPRNPYMSILAMHIDDLRPEDNAFYACEALAGPHWRAIAPTHHEGVGRVTVWFAPTKMEVRSSYTAKEQETSAYGPPDKSKGLVYGLSHVPSKLVCQTLCQPPPKWIWNRPQSGPDVPLGEPSNLKGYKQIDYQDGELSVSELIVPAGYWNVGVFGTYSCTASNRFGSVTGHLRLKLATHPGRPSMRACKVEAKMIELCVDPPDDTGGLPLTHYELRIQTHPRDAFFGPFAYLPGRRLLRLPHLIPGYYYRFALSAVSAAGRGPNAYLQVTTNRLSMPAIQMLTAPEYIEPTAYTVHWNTAGSNGPEIDLYKVNIRPVEVDYSMGEVAGRPIGQWTEFAIERPTCNDISTHTENVTVCHFRVDNLKPDSAYELELSGQNAKGFTEAQRIIFRTSASSGESGKLLNIPSYLRQTSGNSVILVPHATTTLCFLIMLSFPSHFLI